MKELVYAMMAGSAMGWLAVPHCCAMCGPLHVSICALNRTKSLQALSVFNLGRIGGYAAAGVLFGALGGFVDLGARYCCGEGLRGAVLSLLFPGITMGFIAHHAFRKKNLKSPKTGWMTRFFNGSLGKLTAGGACTTLIPCGMLYAAFAMAAGTGCWWKGGGFMFAFVVTQTFFMQLGISLGRIADKKWGARFEKTFPWICLAIALFYLTLFVRKLTAAV